MYFEVTYCKVFASTNCVSVHIACAVAGTQWLGLPKPQHYQSGKPKRNKVAHTLSFLQAVAV